MALPDLVLAALARSTDVVLVTDLSLEIVFVSDGAQRVLGHDPASVVGRNGLEFLHPDDVELFAATAFSTVEQGYETRGATAPYRVLDATGDYQTLDVQGGPFAVDGEPQGFWMVGRRSLRGEIYAEVLQRLLDEQPLSIALENTRSLFPRTGEQVCLTSAGASPEPFEVGDRLPAVLNGSDGRTGSPWDVSTRTGERVVCDDVGVLDDDIRRAAERDGLASVMVMPVRGRSGETAALLTVWFAEDMPSAATATRAAEPVRDLVEAALRIRSQFDDLKRSARTDALTGLANRVAFRDALSAQSGEVAVLYIDLDGFKPVNDTHGHHVGDALLRVVAARLDAAVRAGDVVARLGGDEFAVLCPACDRAEAAGIAERILGSVEEPVAVESVTVGVSASIGVAFAPSGDRDEVLQRADAALYEAKRGGRNTVRFAG